MSDIITNERAQAMQIGFILIFGLFILMLTMYQANIVPDQNRKAEITHSNELEFEFSNIESNIFNTGMKGTPTTESYQMSMRYPSRLITINPYPPDWNLYTSSPKNITISNETMEHNVSTRFLEQNINYRLYEKSPTYTHEQGFIYRNFGEEQTRVIDNQFVLNDGFAIVALQGEYNETGYDSVRLQFEQTDSLVKYEISDPEITVPTKLDESSWREFEDKRSNLNIDYNDEDKDNIKVTISRDGNMELYLTSVSLSESTDGGVNHNDINLPESDTQDSPNPDDSDNPEVFEFTDYNSERTGNDANYDFDVSAGEADLDSVTVEVRQKSNDKLRDEDNYEQPDPRQFSESGKLSIGTGSDATVVFIAEDTDGNRIEEKIDV